MKDIDLKVTPEDLPTVLGTVVDLIREGYNIVVEFDKFKKGEYKKNIRLKVRAYKL